MAATDPAQPQDEQHRRKLIAVLYADMVGYSRLIGLDDVGTLDRLKTLRHDLIDPAITEHGGRIVQTGGDSLLVVFDSIDRAVHCAVTVQRQIPAFDSNHPPDQAIRFRIGINIGDVIPDGTDLHGDAVNVAARLQAECPPGGICVSRAVRDHAREQLNIAFEELGDLSLKNIARPVRAFVLRIDGSVNSALTRAPMPGPGFDNTTPLSLLVLPFVNLGGDPAQDYLSEAITEDLTTDLSRLPGTLVASRSLAASTSANPGLGGQKLKARYVVQGSVRVFDAVMRVNIQLTSTEDNVQLWTGRFEQSLADPKVGHEEIVSRLRAALGLHLFRAEIDRSARNLGPDAEAHELLLRARSNALHKQYSFELYREMTELYERVLRLNPSSIRVKCELAGVLTDRYVVYNSPDRGNVDLIERAEALVSSVLAEEPHSERNILRHGSVLKARGHWSEAIRIFCRLLEFYPNADTTYRQLGFCKLAVGDTEDAVPLLQRSIRLDPLSPWNRNAYQSVSQALLILGDTAGSMEAAHRALATSLGTPAAWRAQCYLLLASAQALLGHTHDADVALAEANRLWPFATVRTTPPTMSPYGLPSPSYATQIERLREGLRLAGLRDHAAEDTDWGLEPDDTLHIDLVGPTPTTVPGATTIRTNELVQLVTREEPILIDVALDTWGRSLPAAIALQGSGHGAVFSDNVRNRFIRKMEALTSGNKSTPIVTFCANSERLTSCNLTLRIVELGYTKVYWYRGGFEAWQTHGLPEADLALQGW